MVVVVVVVVAVVVVVVVVIVVVDVVVVVVVVVVLVVLVIAAADGRRSSSRLDSIENIGTTREKSEQNNLNARDCGSAAPPLPAVGTELQHHGGE